MNRYNTVVIGAGLSGLVTACHLARSGQKVLLVAQGVGALLLTSGCIDVLGFQPASSKKPVKDPLGSLDDFLADNPNHPYGVVGKNTIQTGLTTFQQIINGAVTYTGTAEKNWLLPSPAGAIHPTCLAPTSLANGELSQTGSMLIVGFGELRDFYPGYISQNLNAQQLGIEATPLTIEAPPPVSGRINITPIELAKAFEQAGFRESVIAKIKRHSKKFDRVGFPAVLGLTRHKQVLTDLEKKLGITIFEISTLLPSAPGRRLFEALRTAFLQANGRLIIGSKVVDGAIEAGRVTQIRFETSNRLRTVKADNFVLATGGIFGGGIQTDAGGQVWEPVFGLPINAEPDRHKWFSKRFLDSNGQPVARFGVQVNQHLNPVDQNSRPIAPNLYIAGSLMANADWTRGRTGDGLALATAAAITDQITQETV